MLREHRQICIEVAANVFILEMAALNATPAPNCTLSETEIAKITATAVGAGEDTTWVVEKGSPLVSFLDHLNWVEVDADNVSISWEDGETLVFLVASMPRIPIKMSRCEGRLANLARHRVTPHGLRHLQWWATQGLSLGPLGDAGWNELNLRVEGMVGARPRDEDMVLRHEHFCAQPLALFQQRHDATLGRLILLEKHMSFVDNCNDSVLAGM